MHIKSLNINKNPLFSQYLLYYFLKIYLLVNKNFNIIYYQLLYYFKFIKIK